MSKVDKTAGEKFGKRRRERERVMGEGKVEFFPVVQCVCLCAFTGINLFNLKVFIIYLVRCYFLFEMKIILLSRGTNVHGRSNSGHIQTGENGVNHW